MSEYDEAVQTLAQALVDKAKYLETRGSSIDLSFSDAQELAVTALTLMEDHFKRPLGG